MLHPTRSSVLMPLLLAAPIAAQDAPAPITIADLPQSQYFLLEARDQNVPERGRGLLIVLPGGAATAEFLPWVRNGIHRNAPDDFLCAMLVAPKWNADQKIVWPMAGANVAGMRYTTAEYVLAVIKDVGTRHKVDPKRTVVLTWSSGGPAVWEILFSEYNPFPRAYVAMSVFREPTKHQLANAKDLRVLLDQSPDDTTTPFKHAEHAREVLAACGAVVRLVRYAGGHGWQDDPQSRIREGLRWLLSDEKAPAPTAAAPKPAPAPGANLLKNGGFEAGDGAWMTIDNSGTLKVEKDTKDKKEGKASLHLVKTGKLPLDLIRQDVKVPDAAGKLTARAWVKCKGAGNAFVKLFLHDADDKVVHEDVDIVQLRGDADWKRVEKTWEVKGAKTAVFQVVMVMGGEVWIDGAEVVVGK